MTGSSARQGVLPWYLVDDPGAVEVSVLRGLPPAEARGGGACAQRDLQSHQTGLVAAVAEQEVLEEAPGQPPVHRVLQEHGLGAGVRGSLATAQTQEELHESGGRNAHWAGLSGPLTEDTRVVYQDHRL